MVLESVTSFLFPKTTLKFRPWVHFAWNSHLMFSVLLSFPLSFSFGKFLARINFLKHLMFFLLQNIGFFQESTDFLDKYCAFFNFNTFSYFPSILSTFLLLFLLPTSQILPFSSKHIFKTISFKKPRCTTKPVVI